MAIGPVDITDRCPVCLTIRAVNSPGRQTDLLLDIGLFRDLCPAFGGDLQICHFSAPLDLPLEKSLEGRKPLRNSFRIVKSVNPDDEDSPAQALNDALKPKANASISVQA